MTTTKKSRSSFGSLLKKVALVLLLLPFIRLYMLGQPLIWAVGNFMMLLPFDALRQPTREFWFKHVKIDTNIKYPPQHIPEIMAEDFNMESMRIATENWRYPVVVRGFFKGTTAVEKWGSLDYLPSKLSKFTVPVVQDASYGTKQGDRVATPFEEAFLDIVRDQSKKYLFFPVQSREHFNGTDFSTAELATAINDLVKEDLDLDRIWQGFAGPNHAEFHGSQLIVGYGKATSKETTGTGWHCAGGSNWFAQVVGRKRWWFMDPEYSPYMFPLRGGLVNMMTGRTDMGQLQDHIPTRYVDLDAGDLLYNSPWEWHTIQNYEGISIGAPIREVNVTSTFRNNMHYTTYLILNKIMKDRFGVFPGGFA